MNRKKKDDPDWKARDWVTLRKVVHESWDKSQMRTETEAMGVEKPSPTRTTRKRDREEAFKTIGEEHPRSSAILQNFIDPDEEIFACGSAFDWTSKCVDATCGNCLANAALRKCGCRGRNAKRSAKALSDEIIADWKIGKINSNDEKFKDLIFANPVSCSVCKRFISKQIEEIVNEEVEDDRKKKQKKNPAWVARDWVTLRNVVHESWDK